MPMHKGLPGKTGTAPHADFKVSSQAFKTVDDGVMQKMDAPLTGDWDWDFVAKMIPHLRGSIDIARVELKHGKDPNLTKLAQDIIAAQRKEIKVMNEWLAQHPKGPEFQRLGSKIRCGAGWMVGVGLSRRR